jgi:hypothetical protein
MRTTPTCLQSSSSLKLNGSSSPGKFHPQALRDKDVTISFHPALIVQPLAAFPFANGRIDWVLSKQFALTNRPLSVCDNVTFCTSALPTVSGSVKVGALVCTALTSLQSPFSAPSLCFRLAVHHHIIRIALRWDFRISPSHPVVKGIMQEQIGRSWTYHPTDVQIQSPVVVPTSLPCSTYHLNR